MKVIITGSTGYIGGAVLSQCLSDPAISSIVAVSRRKPSQEHTKLVFVQHDDFTQFPPSVLDHFKGAAACIYCLGTNVPVSPAELNRKINFDYTVSTAKTLAEMYRNRPDQLSPFRFVYLSGALVERDPQRRLLFLSDNRKMRGELERALLQIGSEGQSSDHFQMLIARPGFVLTESTRYWSWLVSSIANTIRLTQLSQALVRLAKGGKSAIGSLVENRELEALS